MKKTHIILLLTLLFAYKNAYSQHLMNKQIRNNKNNELSVLLNSMWRNEFISYGVSYERTFYHFKNPNLKPYLSGQIDVLMRAKIEGPFNISSNNNQLQTFIKYNFGIKAILSVGFGAILVGERFFLNPTLMGSYKYDLKKIKCTLSGNCQVSRWGRIPPIFTKNPISIPPGAHIVSNSIFNNICYGISLGKYF